MRATLLSLLLSLPAFRARCHTLTTAQVKDDFRFLRFLVLSDLRLSLAEIKPSTY